MKQSIAAALVFASLGFAQNIKIIAPGMADQLVAEIKATSPNVRIVNARDIDMAKEVVDADAVLGGISPANFALAKKLKWVHVSSAGVEKDLFRH